MKKALALLLISSIFMANGCTSETTINNSILSSKTKEPARPLLTACPPLKDPQVEPPKKGDTVAVLDTDFGTIKFRLFTKDVPTLSKNFIELAKSGKYDNSPFHRVVQGFMIQGGDFTNHDGTGGHSYLGPDKDLANEIVPSLHHLCGTVSMAKTSAPVSIGSQFFIVTGLEGAAFLDGGYSPIGQVYEGIDVAGKIEALQIPDTELPSQTVNVKKVTITTFGDEETSPAQN